MERIENVTEGTEPVKPTSKTEPVKIKDYNTWGLCHFLCSAPFITLQADVWERQTEIYYLVPWNPFSVMPGITPGLSSHRSFILQVSALHMPPPLCFLTLTSYFHHVCHPRPLPDLWTLKLLEHPFILLLQLLCGPDMLNPYSPTRSAKRQKSGPQTSLYSHGLTEAWHTGQLINIFQVDGWLLLEFLALPTCCWH